MCPGPQVENDLSGRSNKVGFASQRLLRDYSPCPTSDLERDSDSFNHVVTFSKVESSDAKETHDSGEGLEASPENS